MHANAHGVYEIIILVTNHNVHKTVLYSVVNLKVCLTLHLKARNCDQQEQFAVYH